MSGGNCPETPRQKMIGMMYLFYTALMALNVSNEVLNAFVAVNAGIQQTTENFSIKTGELYGRIDGKAAEQPAKADAEGCAEHPQHGAAGKDCLVYGNVLTVQKAACCIAEIQQFCLYFL